MTGALEHALVPFHEVLSNEQALIELEPLGLVRDGFVDFSALPLIAIDDPALLGACVPRPAGVSADWPINSVVRIERRSVYAGISIFYRGVSQEAVFPLSREVANASGLMFMDEPDESEDSGQADLTESLQRLAEEEEKLADEQEKMRRGEVILTDDELESLQQAAGAALSEEEDFE
jgi:DNA-directed RNA polymerase subunit H (RpoH/RPB5)